MYPLIFRITSRYLLPIFLLFSLIVLYQGHNAPGGGFIGGLLAATAFIMSALAYGGKTARKKLKFNPATLVMLGLLTAVFSGILSLLKGDPFLTGLWIHIHLPLIGELHLGTPLLFDLGIFLTVIGITLWISFGLLEENE
ncbi:MAG: Na+/H+ antiporter subunit B [Calditrichaeota bacterium]|nr:Na+/H+ antiporter subunit B [Calditrichota bacterium]RQW07084.1 MAG: Na+/H+ antiporter subunit B [Calditrichota bacterium]